MRLGSTGLEVGRLSLGGLFVSSLGGELADSREAVRAAVERGVNYIDTAPSYANSEETVGKCLEGIDAPVAISTKLGGRPRPFDPRDKAGLRWSFEQSLKLLGRDAIDILFVHEPDRPGQYDWWTDRERVIGPVLELLEELKSEGLIRYTGLGGTTAYELARLMRTGKFDVVLTAFNYSLLFREAEHEVLPVAEEMGMGVVIGSPMQQGLLGPRFDDEITWVRFVSKPRREQLQALYALVDESGMPLPEMAIRFPLSHPAVHTILTGVRSRAEVEQNAAAVERGPLPADLLRRIDEIAAMVPFLPRDEPSGLGWMLSKPERWTGPSLPC
ncbi:MAG: aldo/keto reductase [Planctomycetota bacterium]|jgi:aryl-alcohol dehydrogenase-like predicted oxidoreductase